MTGSDDLVELLERGGLFSTFQGEFLVRFDPEVAGLGERRQYEEGRVHVQRKLARRWPFTERSRPDDLSPTESRVVIAVERPDRYREQDFDEEDPLLLVRDGARWWVQDDDGLRSSETAAGRPTGARRGRYEILVCPATLPEHFTFEVTGTAQRAGREVVRATAQLEQRFWGMKFEGGPDGFTQSSDMGAGLPPFGNGDKSFEVEVDRETGVVLRIASVFEGRDWTAVEAVEARFGEPIPSATFQV